MIVVECTVLCDADGCRRNSGFPYARTGGVAREVARGHGWTHRPAKPGNRVNSAPGAVDVDYCPEHSASRTAVPS